MFAIAGIAGCVTSGSGAQKAEMEDETLKSLGDSLYESFWIDGRGNPRSR